MWKQCPVCHKRKIKNETLCWQCRRSCQHSTSILSTMLSTAERIWKIARGMQDKWSTLITEGEANGCFPCDTCNGFRGKGQPCAFCSTKIKAYEELVKAQRVQSQKDSIKAPPGWKEEHLGNI